jgi:NodT family efflux transporter outer membrane factor (OMF) lipoprotein
MTKRIPVFLVPLALGACAVGPDYKRPDTVPASAGYTPERVTMTSAASGDRFGAAQRLVDGQDLQAEWWTVFKSPALDDLVARSLKTNPSLTAAEAALRQSRELVAAQKGTWYPQVTAGFSASRNLTPIESLSAASPTGNPYYSLVTPQLNVSFVPDVFGANYRAVEALQAQAENQRFQLEATYLTLTSNVVMGAVQEASLRGQIAATEQTIKAERDLLDILRKQQTLGGASGADVAAQEAALAQSEQALPPLRKQLAQQRDALTALAGRFPSEEIEAKFNLMNFTLPTDLPVSLPSKLVEQRPDIRQAEENLHAASANIGQAVAARLPQITLGANVGNSADSFSKMFAAGTNFWTLSAGVTGPVFEGFSLLHKERAARAAFDQAAAQYKMTVLTAFQNVADTLRALQADADAVRAADASVQAASRSLDIVKKQLALGQIPYTGVLAAENTYQLALVSLVQAQANRLSDTAALFQALGGGWWNRPVEKEKPAAT